MNIARLHRHGMRQSLAAVPLAVLAACGGGGSSAPDATQLTLSGTAATGAAIAGSTVEIKCAAGTASAAASTRTAPDGSYTLPITDGKLPCVARVTAADGTVLHTVASGSGNTATANLTPATQLVVARLAATDPAAFYAAFDATAAAAIDSSALAAAQAAVITVLKAGGADLSGVGDLISTPLKARSGNSSGDAYDAALDALAATLASTSTALAAIADSLVAEAAALKNGQPPATPTVALPADMLLRRAADHCPALRSGSYRAVLPRPGSTLPRQIGIIALDAKTLAVVYPNGTSGQLAAADEACHFLGDSGKTDVTVSQAGVVVWRQVNDDGKTFQVAVTFPEQTHALAELKGDWNMIGMQMNAAGTAYTGVAGSMTLDGSGAQASFTRCQNDTTWSVKGSDCSTTTVGLPGLRVDAAGGYDVVDATGATFARAFAYRAGNGDLMLVQVNADGSFQLRSRQRTNALPKQGAVSTAWNNYIASTLLSPSGVDADRSTILSVDTAARSWVRTRQTLGTTNDHPETLLANSPRNGYTARPAGTATAIDGSTVTVREFTNLPLGGMGINGLVVPCLKWFDIGVTQP